MPYEFDVFLSYRRWREWPRWVKNNFLGLFEHWLGEELDWDPKIFFDERDIEQGSWWDVDLALKHSSSKVLVPLFSRKYFQSEWCKIELSLMLAREQMCGLRCNQDRRVLIKPAILHDGNKFPTIAQRLQGLEIQTCVSTRLSPTSQKYEKLEEHILSWVPSVARAIENAPPYDNSWENLNITTFEDAFQQQVGVSSNPSFG